MPSSYIAGTSFYKQDTFLSIMQCVRVITHTHGQGQCLTYWQVNNNNNNNPICKAPECQKTSVALAGRNSRAN